MKTSQLREPSGIRPRPSHFIVLKKMSTEFEIYPTSPRIPTFGEVIDLAYPRIVSFLKEFDINFSEKMVFDVRTSEHKSLELARDALFDWKGEGYVWFFYEDICGGTDAYCESIEESDIECWTEESEENERIKERLPELQKSFEIGHYWDFRRSAGQPAIINLSYGFLAAATAELTDGIIHSWDSAWDYERLPCKCDVMYEHWFRSEDALNEDKGEWYTRCIEGIRNENKIRTSRDQERLTPSQHSSFRE
ncbi:hypothetical protein [Rubellicoccus peritrichatus]|uniref:Uncharacterized protein n=1 Tax=Rubellicoccus peritrichatus TaxID=3080537 RepID=A0AAQ3QXP8_9BACT|nr:hypothetical protein [Puniceicoccus sp. CR14]WOO43080.1 hypothetical protein RZN69_08235 [Puniceicoccus sp. CR14]